jgi:hypothetical protein
MLHVRLTKGGMKDTAENSTMMFDEIVNSFSDIRQLLKDFCEEVGRSGDDYIDSSLMWERFRELNAKWVGVKEVMKIDPTDDEIADAGLENVEEGHDDDEYEDGEKSDEDGDEAEDDADDEAEAEDGDEDA